MGVLDEKRLQAGTVPGAKRAVEGRKPRRHAVRIADAVDAPGTVYVGLPPSRQAGGQVTVHFRGRQETYQALNASDRAIPSGERVRVVAVLDGQTVLVEPF